MVAKLTCLILDVGLDSLCLELAESSNEGAAGGVGSALPGAADLANNTLGVDSDMGEGEEHIALLAPLQ